ncbi:hypothetical protein L195_g060165, partial [Trifolium pratense]
KYRTKPITHEINHTPVAQDPPPTTVTTPSQHRHPPKRPQAPSTSRTAKNHTKTTTLNQIRTNLRHQEPPRTGSGQI